MVHALAPRPVRMGVQPVPPVIVPHIAVGLWVGIAVVLLCPSPRHQVKKRPADEDLLRAYSAVMTPFSLL